MTATHVPGRIDMGADVIGRDGNTLGTVAHVVVRSPAMHITDIVVSTGPIFGHDVVIPVNRVTNVADSKVHLAIIQGELQNYPKYIKVNYEPPPGGSIPPNSQFYPPEGAIWPAGGNQTAEEGPGLLVDIPRGTVPINAGMEVDSRDGHQIGTVDAVDTDPATEDVKGLVIKHGFLFTHDVRLPVSDVLAIRDGKVVLKLTKDEV